MLLVLAHLKFLLPLCTTACLCVSCSVVSDSLWPHGSSGHGILQARIPECIAIPFSWGSSQPRDQTHVSYIAWSWFLLKYISNTERFFPLSNVIIFKALIPIQKSFKSVLLSVSPPQNVSSMRARSWRTLPLCILGTKESTRLGSGCSIKGYQAEFICTEALTHNKWSNATNDLFLSSCNSATVIISADLRMTVPLLPHHLPLSSPQILHSGCQGHL